MRNVEQKQSQVIRGVVVNTEPLLPVIDSGEYTCEVRRIMPDDAAFLLDFRNPRNRALRKREAASMVRDIENGDWQLNGESIKFDDERNVVDGQHRLHACREADIPLDTLVITGLAPNVQGTVDVGMKRTFSDRLTLDGEVNGVVLAAALRRLWVWHRTGHVSFDSAFRPTTTEMKVLLDEHPHLRESVRLAREIYNVFPFLPQPVVAVTHYVLQPIDSERCEEFFEQIRTGASLDQDDPVLTLRQRVITERDVRGKKETFTRNAAYVIRAWNAFIEDRPLGRIIHQPGKPVPAPVGLKTKPAPTL